MGWHLLSMLQKPTQNAVLIVLGGLKDCGVWQIATIFPICIILSAIGPIFDFYYSCQAFSYSQLSLKSVTKTKQYYYQLTYFRESITHYYLLVVLWYKCWLKNAWRGFWQIADNFNSWWCLGWARNACN